MGNQAKVSSLDALDQFRASLVIFLGKARRSVSDAGDEARNTRMWLQHDRMVYWESEIRKRSKIHDQLPSRNIMSARLSKNNENALTIRKNAVAKAKRALEEAQDKVRRVKQWAQNFDNAADPIVKRMESVRQYLDVDMPKAIAYLVNLQRTLAAYAEGPPPEAASAPSAVTPEAGAEANDTTGAAEISHEMYGSGGNLVQAVKDLMFEWDQTRASWNDVKSREFERKFLEDLPGQTVRATAVMEELDALLKKVRNDCE